MTDYAFAELLRDQLRTRKGYELLQSAIELCDHLLIFDDMVELGIGLRIQKRKLTRALSILQEIQHEQTASSCLAGEKPFEPGVVGERLRACDEALEYVLSNMHSLRKDDYSKDWADVLAENCGELGVRALALADHIRHEGLV